MLKTRQDLHKFFSGLLCLSVLTQNVKFEQLCCCRAHFSGLWHQVSNKGEFVCLFHCPCIQYCVYCVVCLSKSVPSEWLPVPLFWLFVSVCGCLELLRGTASLLYVTLSGVCWRLSFISTINQLSMAEPPWPLLNAFDFGSGRGLRFEKP